MISKRGISTVKGAIAAAVLGTALFAAAAPAGAATISVNTNSDAIADDVNCSLREAINAADSNLAANGCAGGDAGAVDVITLDAPANNYPLTLGPIGENSNAGGDLDVTTGTANLGLIIRGTGSGSADPVDTIQQTLGDRVIENFGGQPLTLDRVVIQGGNQGLIVGGGVSSTNGGPLTLTHSQVTNNHSASGGGIYSLGALTITDSTIGPGNSSRVGGGITAQNGGLAMTRSVVRNNTATEAVDAASDSIVAGGIEITGTTANPVLILNSVIRDNQANAQEAGDSAHGAGLVSENSNTTVQSSVISGNSVGPLGTNASAAGVSFEGGNPSTSAVINSTISGNSIAPGLGTRTAQAVGAGIGSTLTVAQTTISGNTAPVGAYAIVGAFTMRGSIVDQGANGCSPPATANAHNADAGTSCVGPAAPGDTDIPDATLNLGPLADNGTPFLQTHALGSGSGALDIVPPAACLDLAGDALLTDQRGAERPSGTNCDAGSYEAVTCNGQIPTLLGGPGDDTLTGGASAESIVGSAGNDTLTGGTAADQICGGSGNDTILAKDGVADAIDCGPGTDSATFDHGLDTVANCEIDTDTPLCPQAGGCGGPGPQPPPNKPRCPKGKKLKKIKKKHGKKRFKCVKKKAKKKKPRP